METTWTKKSLAKMIDHTVLKAAATSSDVKKLCNEAKEYGFASVCVNPAFVSFVKNELAGSPVLTCSVVGFPLGAHDKTIKAEEARLAVSQGADEIDMVINIGALKEGNFELVEEDIRGVVDASEGAVVKVIIETCYLTDEEKVKACRIAEKAGAHFVKTSTGFGTAGAVIEDVSLMKKSVSARIKVKASGGIRTLQETLAMIEAGADRIGASAGITILDELT